MALSWHNFFFGAFEPGASVSIDKPPVDLWLQVASVKLLGFSSTHAEAARGVRRDRSPCRCCSPPSGACGARSPGSPRRSSLAVLPVEVITSRSDTMDAVMMVLIVLALLLIVRACETGRARWLLAGAAVLGLAFDVKLLESLVALPGLAVLALPGLAGRRAGGVAAARRGRRGVRRRRAAWLTATLLVPAHDRP